jgi:ribonuclease HII
VPDFRVEALLWGQGLQRVAGVDEAGRGSWAGPVVAAAVVLPSAADCIEELVDVRDSKLLTARQRELAADVIRNLAVDVGIGVAPVEVVDELGLSCAGQLAFWRAVRSLSIPPEFLLVDGFPLWSDSVPQAAILQGDQRCLSIAAASIIAKVTRDEIMRGLDLSAPGYGFAQNCGYGTAGHREALRQFGPSPFHRRSFEPVSAATLQREPA